MEPDDLHDMTGRKITVGCILAHAQRLGNSAQMKIGKVIEIKQVKNKCYGSEGYHNSVKWQGISICHWNRNRDPELQRPSIMGDLSNCIIIDNEIESIPEKFRQLLMKIGEGDKS